MIRYALLLNKIKLFFSRPPSNLSYKLLTLNAIQSDEAPSNPINKSKIQPWISETVWQFNPNFPLQPQKNFPLPQPAVAASSSKGFNIQINMLSMVPAQLLNFISLTLRNLQASFNWTSSESALSPFSPPRDSRTREERAACRG